MYIYIYIYIYIYTNWDNSYSSTLNLPNQSILMKLEWSCHCCYITNELFIFTTIAQVDMVSEVFMDLTGFVSGLQSSIHTRVRICTIEHIYIK